MQTPWGELSKLDLADHDVAANILFADKHSLVEGLVVECLLDQIVGTVPTASDNKVIALDVDSVVVDTGSRETGWLGFVWARNYTEGLGRYLLALEQCLTPYLVSYQDSEFWATLIQNGKRASQPRLLSDLAYELSGGRMRPFDVSPSVRNRTRQRQAFWGFISDFYKDRLGERIVLPRVLINYAIQPYFRAVWNLDRVFVVDNDVWLFEIKHKFPMERNGLAFGINDGELRVVDRLASAGIRCLFTILAKPYWSKEVGSMYLLNDLNMRARAAIIATVLDAAKTTQLMQSQSGTSGAHTSITGKSGQRFKSVTARDFKILGQLSDPPAAVAKRMSAVLTGEASDSVQDEWLRSLKVPDL